MCSFCPEQFELVRGIIEYDAADTDAIRVRVHVRGGKNGSLGVGRRTRHVSNGKLCRCYDKAPPRRSDRDNVVLKERVYNSSKSCLYICMYLYNMSVCSGDPTSNNEKRTKLIVYIFERR